MTRHLQAAHVLLRRNLLQAVDELVRDRGWEHTTMAAVAQRAGVSRQTVYNEFRSRPALAASYVAHEVDRLLTDAEQTAAAHADDPRAALAAAFGSYLRLASDEPLIKTLAGSSSGSELLPLLTETALAHGVPRLATLMQTLWPTVAAADAVALADAAVRLGVSHALAPRAAPEPTAEVVVRLLGPFLDLAVG